MAMKLAMKEAGVAPEEVDISMPMEQVHITMTSLRRVQSVMH